MIRCLISLTFLVTASAQICSLPCGPGEICSFATPGSGISIPDCVPIGGSIVGGGGGGVFGRGLFGRRRHRGRFVGDGMIVGGGFPTVLPPIDGVGVFPPVRGVGVMPPVGGVGVVRSMGADSPNVGIVQPGGVGPAVAQDTSRNTNLNLNISNNNVNQHDHSGGGGTQVNAKNAGGVLPGPACRFCQSHFECPGGQCVFNPSCGNIYSCV